MKKFEAIDNFKAEQEDDLDFKIGDILTIISTR
jgi:ribosomal protein S17